MSRRGATRPTPEKRRFPASASQATTLLGRAKALLRKHGLHARKGLGQNFLVDEDVLARIVEAADLHPTDLVVEVGPGLGVLTEEVAKHAGRVAAVEVDPGAVAVLREVLAGYPNVEVRQADILNVKPQELLREAGWEVAEEKPQESGTKTVPGFKVVANLPYYITSLVLRHFLEASRKPQSMVLMLQREVADRIVAKPGAMSVLSVSVQVYGRPEIVAHVPASSFFPVPKVDSAVLRIDVFPHPVVPEEELPLFFEVVHAGFSQARKQLHNAIGQRIWLPPEGASQLLDRAGVDPQRRAQTLSLAEWRAVARELRSLRSKDEGNHESAGEGESHA